MALLEATGLTKNFGGVTAINNVSFSIEENEILGMLGPNGAGKTTLFNLISGFHKVSAGTIVFNDTEITGRRPDKICQIGIARTFQITRPFPDLTCLQNVMVGAFNTVNDVDRAEAIAEETLDFIGMASKKNKIAGLLSVPERKRLETARALATKPKLLLLDEVMAGLTPAESEEMIQLILKIKESGITIFLIEHVMKAIMTLSNRLIVLNYGEKIASGSSREIAADQNVIKAYLGKEFKIV